VGVAGVGALDERRRAGRRPVDPVARPDRPEGVANCPVSLFSQVGQLEDRLALNPRARRQAGIVVVATGAERTGRRLPNSRERERLLRG
jgi:hypothetical protein